MKRMSAFLLCMLFLLTLCACANSSKIYTVEKNEKSFEINSENNTIFDGTHTYKYTFSGNSSSYRIDITYPNGATYHWDQSESSGHGGWSDDYDEKLYVDGDTLCDVIVEKAPTLPNTGKALSIVLFIIIGIFYVAAPGTAWYLGYGWRYKNAEPSDTALVLYRVIGIIAIVASICMIFS